MKAINSTFVLTILLLIQSCGNKIKVDNKTADIDPRSTKSFELLDYDTINRTDVSGNKQGRWVIRKPIVCTKTVQAIYAGESNIQTSITTDTDLVKLEEGNYVDNKKEGLWKTFYPSGRLKDSANYKNDVLLK